MSILMDALKQQSALPTNRPDPTVFWRKLALALALLVALLSGALLAYWLQPSRSAPVEKTPEVSEPAQPAQILAVLQHSVMPEVSPQTKAQTDTGARTVEKQQEVIAAEKPIPTVTAGSGTDATQSSDSVNKPVAAKAVGEAEVAVSDELRDKFSAALKATELTSSNSSNTSLTRQQSAPAKHISELDEAILQQIPALRFDAHVYATSATQRWVKVNGKTLQEGQWVTADIRIREITQQYVLLELGNQLFSIAALSEWPGN